MKKSIYTGLLLASMSLFYVTATHAEGVGSANVEFGKPQNGQTECEGKGICMLTSIGATAGMVGVKFTLVEDPAAGFYTLTLQFNISAMSSANHDYLYAHFLYPDGEPRPRFVFEGDYTFTDRELCRSLGIDVGTLTVTPSSTNGMNNIQKLNDADIRLTYIIPMTRKK